jgi:hypothetical protein
MRSPLLSPPMQNSYERHVGLADLNNGRVPEMNAPRCRESLSWKSP